ncbi:decarboxylating NADP(+)-dependent phosphogluconate dehydrogenase [Fibrobacterota bacterium]
MGKEDMGLIGLAVMGENLVLNMESKGFTVAVYNRTKEKVDNFIAGRGKGKKIVGTHSVEDLAAALKIPRKVMIMVKAGEAVDRIIEQLLSYLEPGDIIIDGGNSKYQDTDRRTKFVESKGLRYIGTGVSGGEEGALNGPSLMPGGSHSAWEEIRPIFQAIAAKVEDGSPCCEWVGDNGAGHFVKMVHNGIEYGDIQIICEAYHIMKEVLGLSTDEMHTVFKEWNEGDLDSYLIEITRDILAFKDENGTPMIDNILDTAGQKGTGKWTGIAALDLGIPLTLIGESVFARSLSAMKDERVKASETFTKESTVFSGDKKEFIDHVGKALFAAKIVSYAQGFSLIRAASEEFGWNINYGDIALIWRGGCIIRSAFLGKIKEAFTNEPNLTNLLLAPYFTEKIQSSERSWREVVSIAVKNGIPVPALSSALSYFDGFTTNRLPANLLQAQRDYFGAHQYERVDKPRGEFFHTNWTGKGGTTASTTYSA